MPRENVVLIVVDDAIGDMWSKMTYLDSLPDGRWAKFPNAVVNYPLCGPSRLTLWTGRYNHHLDGMYWHGEPGDTAVTGTLAHWDNTVGPTHMFPEWIRKAGYHNACIGKYLNIYPWSRGDAYIPAGWHEWKVWLDDVGLGGAHATHDGPTHFDYVMNVNGTTTSFGSADTWTTTGADASGRVATTDYDTDRLSSMAMKFLDTAREPWYIHSGQHAVKIDAGNVGRAARHAGVAYTTEHSPSFNEADISDKPAWLRGHKPTVGDSAQVTDWDNEQKNKWRSALAIDEFIRDLITKLKALGSFDRTCIIVMTENSNHTGQHRLDKKGLPYEQTITTPIYVRHPSIPLANMTSNALVSTIDICPTIADIAQTRASRPMDGMSILPLLDGRITAAQWRQTALFSWINNTSVNSAIPSYEGVRTLTHKYVEVAALSPNPAETELYDLAGDPDELTNRTNDSALAATKADLANRLAVFRST